MTKWYTEAAQYAYLKREKPNLLAYAGWIAENLQKAFEKGEQIGAANFRDRAEEAEEAAHRLADELKEAGQQIAELERELGVPYQG